MNYTVTGVTTSNADGKATPGTAESFTAVASGDGYVKVVLSDLSDATATYTVTGFSDKLPNLYDYDSTIGSGRTFTATATSNSVNGGETVGVVISVDRGLLTTTEGGLIVTFDIGGTERSMTLLNDGQKPDDIVLEVTVNEDIEIAVVDVEILDAPTVTSVEVTESSYDADDVLTAGSFPDSITLNFSAPVEDAPALTGGTVQFGEGELSDDGMSATYTVTTNGADTDGFSIAASEIVGENGVINVTATSFTVDGETVTVND